MNVNRNILIIESSIINTPVLMGVLKPKIFIPHNIIEKFSKEEFQYIFIHEFVHYKRKDILLNWLNVIVLSAYWFNPIVWFLIKEIKKYCEISCDEITLSKIGSNEYSKYGMTLVKLVSIFSKSLWIPGSASMVNKTEIKGRIIMITKFKRKSLICSIIAVFIIFAVGCGGLTNASSKNKKLNSSAGDKVVLEQKIDTEKPSETNTLENTSQKVQNNTTQNLKSNVSQQVPQKAPQQVQQQKSTNTNVKNTNESVKNPNEYVNEKIGFSITFPDDWKGKYTVSEINDNVYFEVKSDIPQKDPRFKDDKFYGWIFRIEKGKIDYDRVCMNNFGDFKYFTSKGQVYSIVGPSSLTMQEDDPSFKDYVAMYNQVEGILKTFKVLK